MGSLLFRSLLGGFLGGDILTGDAELVAVAGLVKRPGAEVHDQNGVGAALCEAAEVAVECANLIRDMENGFYNEEKK